jgi:hypothetical protein
MDNNLRMKEALFIFYPTNFGRYQLTCTHLKSYHMNQVFLFFVFFSKKEPIHFKKKDSFTPIWSSNATNLQFVYGIIRLEMRIWSRLFEGIVDKVANQLVEHDEVEKLISLTLSTRLGRMEITELEP